MEVSTKDQTCRICEKVFSNKSKLNMHTKVAHKEKKKSLKCNECDSYLSSKKSLKVHTFNVKMV